MADGEPGVRSLDEDNRVLNEGDTVSMEKLMGADEEAPELDPGTDRHGQRGQ